MRFINRKKETVEAVIEIIGKIEYLFHQKSETLKCVDQNSVKRLRAGGGGEYVGLHFQN